MHSQSACKKLLFDSSSFAVYSSEERQLVWGLVMGFSIVCKRQGVMDMLTSTEDMENLPMQKVTTRDLHVTDTSAHSLRPLLRGSWKGGPLQFGSRGGLQQSKLTSSPHRRTNTPRTKEGHCPETGRQAKTAGRERERESRPTAWPCSSSRDQQLEESIVNTNSEETTASLWDSVFSPMEWMCSQATANKDNKVTMNRGHSLEKNSGKEAKSTQADGQGL